MKVTEDIKWFVEKIEKDELVSKILIYPFLGKDKMNVLSYDLHVGKYAKFFRDGEVKRIDEKNPLEIKPGEAVVLLTEEYIGLPQDVLGLITPILPPGLFMNSSAVDPGFYGRLKEVIVNKINREIILKYRQPFCKIIFLKLDKARGDLRYKGRYKGAKEL